MARVEPFGAHAERYEAWFDRHAGAYVSELLALRPFVPLSGRGLEIGVGSGRFAVVQAGNGKPTRQATRDSVCRTPSGPL